MGVILPNCKRCEFIGEKMSNLFWINVLRKKVFLYFCKHFAKYLVF